MDGKEQSLTKFGRQTVPHRFRLADLMVVNGSSHKDVDPALLRRLHQVLSLVYRDLKRADSVARAQLASLVGHSCPIKPFHVGGDCRALCVQMIEPLPLVGNGRCPESNDFATVNDLEAHSVDSERRFRVRRDLARDTFVKRN